MANENTVNKIKKTINPTGTFLFFGIYGGTQKGLLVWPNITAFALSEDPAFTPRIIKSLSKSSPV